MAFKYLIVTVLLGVCANANAEWFLRGTHNAWAATQMESAGAGTNTVQLNSVVFNAAGSIKFDRFGDWKENYGAGGNNIAVAAGTWDIKFFTDTKKWTISAPQALAAYHLRGTNNSWAEGTLMVRAGTSDTFELCVNFAGGDASGGPRFKIDPNGGWGDAIPAADFSVSAGWVKVIFNSAAKTIASQQNLAANCGASASSAAPASSVAAQSSLPKSSLATEASSSVANSVPASIYHLRGTFNSWLEGTLMTRVGNSDNYERCVNFAGGDNNGGPRFKVDPNGGWGDAIPAADVSVSAGWVKITFNSVSKGVSMQQNLAANCLLPESNLSSSSSFNYQSSLATSSQSVQGSIYHVRGTFNTWLEGTLLNRIGATDNYERCVNFAGGDGNGGARFKIDPNGGWGDAMPAADFSVATGWVKITFNSSSKNISVQQNLPEYCASPAASSAAASSVAASSVAAPTSPYHIRGTFNNWLEGTLMKRVGTSDNYQHCVNFNQASNRFKVDPNGGWGDAIPAADFIVNTGWVNITFNSTSKSISVQQNLPANCGNSSSANPGEFFFPAEAVYHVRGDFNGWAEGALLLQPEPFGDSTTLYTACVNFARVPQRIRIDKDGGWGIDTLPLMRDHEFVGGGWTRVTLDRLRGLVSLHGGLLERCVDLRSIPGQPLPSPPDVGVPSPPLLPVAYVPIHIRGTHNAFAEGTLMTQIGDTDSYTACVYFAGGDANGGPRFRVDPNGGWGDVFPATDVNVPAGWVAIAFNNKSKIVTKQYNMYQDCRADSYFIAGNQRMQTTDGWTTWQVGDYAGFVDGEPQIWKICRNFGFAGDENGPPRFRIVTNEGVPGSLTTVLYSDERPFFLASGWTSITFTSPPSSSERTRFTPAENVHVTTNMAPNCAAY